MSTFQAQFSGQTALVTGAGADVGRAIALAEADGLGFYRDLAVGCAPDGAGGRRRQKGSASAAVVPDA